ncbi:MAG: DegV family protein [Anaerolineae bacterium]
MTIRLVTDSTCDLPPELATRHNLYVVPINIQFNTTSFKENVTITPAEFYHKIETQNILPQTSQPSVGEFAAAYTALADGGATEIISAHVTAKLSGTFQSAALAAEQVAGRVKVHVVDSMAGSAGLGWMLCHAGSLIARGIPVADIVARIEATRPKITVFFAVDNLKFAQMSGRVGRLTGVLSSVLNIKPVIGLDNGLLNALDKVRSSKAAMQRIVSLTAERVHDAPVNVGVVHALAPERAGILLDLARSTLNVNESFMAGVAISLAVHFGPGTLGLVTYPAS